MLGTTKTDDEEPEIRNFEAGYSYSLSDQPSGHQAFHYFLNIQSYFLTPAVNYQHLGSGRPNESLGLGVIHIYVYNSKIILIIISWSLTSPKLPL
jgi:hypothetical protein